MAEFTIGRNFFQRSSSVVDLNGKGKLGAKEDISPKECANFGPSKARRTVMQSKKVCKSQHRLRKNEHRIGLL